jgi:hypothetical protein
VIYLLVQMFVALVLAGILGAAVGWLVHRAAHARRLDDTRHALARARNQVAHTESEVAMLSDDYDELERRNKAELNSLRHQNQEIPALSTNLEKSQLLVSQLMQKHESKIRELGTENAALSAKLKIITDREQAHDKVKVELDNIRKQKTADKLQLVSSKEDQQVINLSNADTLASDSSIDTDNDFDFGDSINATDLDASNTSGPLEVLDATIVSGPADNFISQLNEATRLPDSDPKPSGSWASAPVAIDADSKDDEIVDAPDEEIIAEDDADDPFDSVMEVGDELQRELDIDADADPMLDGSSDNASLFEFEPVEHQDDLKQIFGIGPITEKALNDLGITSYSQLAELESHEIEKIAGALSIVPGRIERDDWVGNARRQLEDVLEEL